MNFLKRLHKNEEGTALTEFVITLPIFIMVFSGITAIGSVNEKSTRTWARAYKATFDAAVGVQKARVSPHAIAAYGAARGLADLAKLPKDMGIAQKIIVTYSDGRAFYNLGTKGTMGEQYGRVRLTDRAYELRARSPSVVSIEGILTKDITGVVGGSGYSRDLFDDSIRTSSFRGGSGILGTLNAYISGTGLRPTLATGTRYGTVSGSASDSITVGPYTYNASSFVSTLVAPTPTTTIYGSDFLAEAAVTGISRLAMEGTGAYKNVLGIKSSQPLSSSRLTVPCFDKNPNRIAGWVTWPRDRFKNYCKPGRKFVNP